MAGREGPTEPGPEFVLDLGVLSPAGVDVLDEPARERRPLRGRLPARRRDRIALGLAVVVVATAAGGVAAAATHDGGGSPASRRLGELGLDRVLDSDYRPVGAAEADANGTCQVGGLLTRAASEATAALRHDGHAVVVGVRIYATVDAATAASDAASTAVTSTCTSFSSRLADGSAHTLEYVGDSATDTITHLESAENGGLDLIRVLNEPPNGQSGCVIVIRRGRVLLDVESVVDAAGSAAQRAAIDFGSGGSDGTVNDDSAISNPACLTTLQLAETLSLGLPFP